MPWTEISSVTPFAFFVFVFLSFLSFTAAGLVQFVERLTADPGRSRVRFPSRTNTQSLKLTEKWGYFLCLANGSTFAYLGRQRKMAVPSPVGNVKIVSPISTSLLNTLTQIKCFFCCFSRKQIHGFTFVFFGNLHQVVFTDFTRQLKLLDYDTQSFWTWSLWWQRNGTIVKIIFIPFQFKQHLWGNRCIWLRLHKLLFCLSLLVQGPRSKFLSGGLKKNVAPCKVIRNPESR